MGSETKFYCDECGVELGRRAVGVVVLVCDRPKEWSSKFSLERFNRISYKHKEVYSRDLCLECLGEEIQDQWESEPCRDFGLKENARRFLIKHGLLKDRGCNGR